ncbi:protein of unknown function [Vibrio tapetis subsp. tapetis]|uniref:Uncharacterized protein n=1 Tax=Vibrio tapetis subsp. tapetis TaxID=1671868 RepID=A0A2N8ZMS1_9VIBR|nr:protein of unknown function [Vibrio tapetis subsp. tapetis]
MPSKASVASFNMKGLIVFHDRMIDGNTNGERKSIAKNQRKKLIALGSMLSTESLFTMELPPQMIIVNSGNR